MITRHRHLALLLLLVAITSACGSTVTAPESPAIAEQPQVSETVDTLPDPASPATDPSSQPPSSGDGAPAGVPTTGPTQTPGGRSGASPKPAPKPDPNPRTDPPSPTQEPKRDPVHIGVVGTQSGPIGSTQINTVRAVEVWARMVNAAGGLDGHEVVLHIRDDKGESANLTAHIRELVETKGVVAFVATLSAQTLNPEVVDYLEEARIPMIGGDRVHRLWTESPMLFPQASAADDAVWIHPAITVANGGQGVPVGIVSCVEAPLCRDGHEKMKGYFSVLGAKVVYDSLASVSTPDFTAQCLQARDAGVRYFVLAMTAANVMRIASDCAAQGFTPTYVTPQTAQDMAKHPNLQGLRFASATFPWVSSDTPARREFHDAFRTYAPDIELSAHASSGWVSAKLLERAARGSGQKLTSEHILAGLWSVRDDTLGGLTGPLTFTRDQPAARLRCYFPMGIDGQAWVSLRATPVCSKVG